MVSLEEYLESTYEPDCDFVDGQLEERALGEWKHGELQMLIGAYLLGRYRSQGVCVISELRLRVTPSRVRIPDLAVYLQDPQQRVPTIPPFIAIEILSPDDRMSRVERRIADFLNMGAKQVWLIDPETRQAYTATAEEGLREVKSGVLRTADPLIELPLSEAFDVS